MYSNLETIRKEIDQVDQGIVALLEKRMELVTHVTEYKRKSGKAVLDPEREKLLLEKIANQVSNKDFEEAILATYTDLLRHSRNYQSNRLDDK